MWRSSFAWPWGPRKPQMDTQTNAGTEKQRWAESETRSRDGALNQLETERAEPAGDRESWGPEGQRDGERGPRSRELRRGAEMDRKRNGNETMIKKQCREAELDGQTEG